MGGATPTFWEPSWRPRSVNVFLFWFFIYFILFYLRDVFVCGRGMGVSGTYILGAFLETKVSERFYNLNF